MITKRAPGQQGLLAHLMRQARMLAWTRAFQAVRTWFPMMTIEQQSQCCQCQQRVDVYDVKGILD